jgi:hypothetical protein
MTPVNLIEELKAYLDTDAAVTAALGDRIYNGVAPPSADLPYANFHVGESARQNSYTGVGIDNVKVLFHVRATDSSVTTRLAGLLKSRLLPDRDYTPARFDGPYGREIGRYSDGPDNLDQDPERAPYGADCWVYSFPVVWILARG